MKKSVFEPHVPEERQYSPNGYWSVLKEKGNYELIEGHFPYGVHYAYGVSEPRYFVMLRDPVDRAVSHYHFIRACDGPDYFHPKLKDDKENSILEFYKKPENQNLQTRFVAGVVAEYCGRYLNFNNVLGDWMLGHAKHNLIEGYEAFGLKERFQDTVQLFASCLGKEPKKLDGYHKSTPNRPAVGDLPKMTRQSLGRLNALDEKLYQFALNHFDEQ